LYSAWSTQPWRAALGAERGVCYSRKATPVACTLTYCYLS
jgi:hypothetical protein